MGNILRYDLDESEMNQDSDGKFVMHSDHHILIEHLEAKVERLEADKAYLIDKCIDDDIRCEDENAPHGEHYVHLTRDYYKLDIEIELSNNLKALRITE